MKSKNLIISLFFGALALLVSCAPQEPEMKEVTAETCLDMLSAYFPYSIDEKFIFVNESLNKRCESDAHDRLKNGIYPEKHLRVEDEGGEGTENNWGCDIHACMFNNQIPLDSLSYTHEWMERISAYILYNPLESASPIEMIWRVDFRISRKEYFTGFMDVHCLKTELFPMLKDTITLPIVAVLYQNSDVVPEGSYVKIVKNQGMTEFSMDGQTVWKRVKE